MLLTFAMALLVVYLVLAAQFESFIHPLTIMLTVPLGVLGALVGLWVSGGTVNLFSQIGIVMLVGLAAKNGILIVEFANQLRDDGRTVREAILAAPKLKIKETDVHLDHDHAIKVYAPRRDREESAVVFFFFGMGASTSMTSTGLPVGFDADAFWRFGCGSDGGPVSFASIASAASARGAAASVGAAVSAASSCRAFGESSAPTSRRVASFTASRAVAACSRPRTSVRTSASRSLMVISRG